jgi:hypothetical protein
MSEEEASVIPSAQDDDRPSASSQAPDYKRPLYPPVLPPWGSMFPAVPPRGYGDISYDPTEQAIADPRAGDELTPLDHQALALLPSIFPSRRY